jgi:hypothetical protein
MSHQTSLTLTTTGSPPPSVWQQNLHPFGRELSYGYIRKRKEKTCIVEEPSHVKQLSLNHVCKIGLKSMIGTRI